MHELKPRIDRAYNVRRDRANTAIMGSSMGALISLYAIDEYPQVFGGGGMISTHWPLFMRPDGKSARDEEDEVVSSAFERYLAVLKAEGENLPAITFGTLVYGGVMDHYPDLKLCLGHAGGYTAFGVARMDKGWQAGAMENMPEFEDARTFLERAPSEYLNRFWYDSCTYTESTLRYLLDVVGSDRVVLGTDYPAPMMEADPVPWINAMESLSQEEKEGILERNPARLLGL